MGAHDFTTTILNEYTIEDITQAEDAYRAAVEEALFLSGHEGGNGSISTTSGCRIVTPPYKVPVSCADDAAHKISCRENRPDWLEKYGPCAAFPVYSDKDFVWEERELTATVPARDARYTVAPKSKLLAQLPDGAQIKRATNQYQASETKLSSGPADKKVQEQVAPGYLVAYVNDDNTLGFGMGRNTPVTREQARDKAAQIVKSRQQRAVVLKLDAAATELFVPEVSEVEVTFTVIFTAGPKSARIKPCGWAFTGIAAS